MLLYLDLDDVVFDTTDYLEAELGWVKGSAGTVYDSFVERDDLGSMSDMLDYTKIPLKMSVSQIELLNSIFSIVFCTEYCQEKEWVRKQFIVRKLFDIDRIIGINRTIKRKYSLDLSDGILVDDNFGLLQKCNAKYKIWYTPIEEERQGIITVNDFVGLHTVLERLRGIIS